MDASENLRRIRMFFEEESMGHGLKGTLGVAGFKSVFTALLPVQQRRLREMSGTRFDDFMRNGSIICIAYAYPEHAIDSIALKNRGVYDTDSWNVYAGWYHKLNRILNATAEKLAEETNGVAIPATVEGVASRIRHVEDYYGSVVSHRVAAEQSGVGWRGKNELIVNPTFSCAIRLASIATYTPIERTPPIGGSCLNCRACLDACTFLKFKDSLANYREHCRRYIASLGLEADVCGKCVKACYRGSIFRNQFKL